MLPEQPDKSHLFLTYFELDSNKSPHSKLIQSHPFNHEIQLVLPGEQAQAVLNTIEQNEQYYYELEAPLSIVLDPGFLDETLTKRSVEQHKTHSLYMHTIDTCIDTEDVAVIDGDGCLVLSLQKETYESFGLEGRAAKFAGKGQRYIISVDLSAPSFRPGNKSYDRVKWCLDTNLPRPFKMVMTRVNTTTGEVLDIPLNGIQNQKRTLSWKSSTLEGIRLPTFENLILPSGDSPQNLWKSEALEAHEWLGLASLGSQRLFSHDKPDPFLSVYSCPEPYKTGNITILRCRGIATPASVEHLLVILRKAVKLKQCWGALTVWGYRDSPIAWRGREHGFLTSGENDYTILLLNEKKESSDQHAVCYQALGVYDTL